MYLDSKSASRPTSCHAREACRPMRRKAPCRRLPERTSHSRRTTWSCTNGAFRKPFPGRDYIKNGERPENGRSRPSVYRTKFTISPRRTIVNEALVDMIDVMDLLRRIAVRNGDNVHQSSSYTWQKHGSQPRSGSMSPSYATPTIAQNSSTSSSPSGAMALVILHLLKDAAEDPSSQSGG